MTKKDTDFGFELGTNTVPIIERGGSLPLRWNFHDDGRLWVQPLAKFKTNVGPAIITLVDDKSSRGYAPLISENTLPPNGSRGTVKTTLSNMGEFPKKSRPWRRQMEGLDCWWPGTIRITDDDVIFTDAEELLDFETIDEKKLLRSQKNDLFGKDMPDEMIHWLHLYSDLSLSQEFMRRVREDSFATAFFQFIRDHDIVLRSTSQEVMFGSDRDMGDILGELRRVGENYLDFYWTHGTDQQPKLGDQDDLIKILNQIGYDIKEFSE